MKLEKKVVKQPEEKGAASTIGLHAQHEQTGFRGQQSCRARNNLESMHLTKVIYIEVDTRARQNPSLPWQYQHQQKAWQSSLKRV